MKKQRLAYAELMPKSESAEALSANDGNQKALCFGMDCAAVLHDMAEIADVTGTTEIADATGTVAADCSAI